MNWLADAAVEVWSDGWRGRAEALPLFERTLTDSERLLGPEHPHTLAIQSNVTVVRSEVAGNSVASQDR